MSDVVAGAASGFLMASVFVCAGVLMLFPLVKDPTPRLQALFKRLPPGGLVLPIVVLAYPVWGIIGAVMGLLYRVSSQLTPGPGLGSPNLVFTVAVLLGGVMLAVPFAALLRRVLAGVLAIAGSFIGVFGWFLPHFAS